MTLEKRLITATFRCFKMEGNYEVGWLPQHLNACETKANCMQTQIEGLGMAQNWVRFNYMQPLERSSIQMGGSNVQLNPCYIQGIMRVMHNVIKMEHEIYFKVVHTLFVFYLMLLFLIFYCCSYFYFLLLWPTPSKGRPGCGSPCDVPTL